jgi:hypothetical protein
MLRAVTVVALVAGLAASSGDQLGAAEPARAGMAQSTGDDPCRFATAEAIGSAFGRQMKSSKIANVCEYRGTEGGAVVVKVTAGPEGIILRNVKAASAQSNSGAVKVATTVGEAYFDSILLVFIGRVGGHDVQVESSIRPLPRDAMIAAGNRIMETIARK